MLANSMEYIRNSANPTEILPTNRGEMDSGTKSWQKIL